MRKTRKIIIGFLNFVLLKFDDDVFMGLYHLETNEIRLMENVLNGDS